ncbi:MAG: ABC transporter ATP-binding protein [Clostridiales bacterium]|nr:ABC transporter ATP-binding protein [Clostridiales bacterium]
MSIEIRKLHFSYGDHEVLRNLDLRIEPAEVLSILGPNGAGKTTLLKMITGLAKPASGAIVYDGRPRERLNLRQLAQLMGYVPQMIMPTFDFRVIDYVVTGVAPYIGTFERPGRTHYEKARQAIAEMGIGHLTEKSYMQISDGERQQVSIARVLAQEPSYILMDEPTSHLDYGNQLRVLQIIKRLSERGFGIVFTTHNPDNALLLGGKTAILNRRGELSYGNTLEMIREETLSELYGIRLTITTEESTGRSICYMPSLAEKEK